MSKKRLKLSAVMSFFTGMILGVTVIRTIFRMAKIDNFIIDNFIFVIPINIILLRVAVLFQTIIHEGGHLVFGLLSGYKFVSFRIGSFMLLKTKKGFKFKKFSIMGTGGQCLMAPPNEEAESVPYILYNLGGSINNLIAAVLLFILSMYINDTSYLYAFVFYSSVVGIIFAILNAVPIHSVVDNDGYNVINISKNIEAKRCFLNQLKINELISQGIRPKDMPEEYFKIYDEKDMCNSIIKSQSVQACCRAIDNMDFKKAEEIGSYILENSEQLMTLQRYLITFEMIFCELIGENKKEKIDSLYSKEIKKFEKKSKTIISVFRIKYAYCLLYNNNIREAEAVMKLFEKAAKTYPYKSEVEGERELISYIDKIYENNN